MKHADLLFQFFLFGVTATLTIAALLVTGEGLLLIYMMLVGWTIALDICQIVHSFTVAIAFWTKKSIRIALRIYWIVLGAYVLFLLLASEILPHGEFKERLVFPILPALIAMYFWSITLYFWVKRLREYPPGREQNGIMDRLLKFINKTP